MTPLLITRNTLPLSPAHGTHFYLTTTPLTTTSMVCGGLAS
ncbi:MAG: hypothetical protein WKG07_27830 [Hymenobacter sp.]